MSEVNDDDLERLASRLALLVSDTGEADNAGRAAGTLARRLGLSGGDLKEMFLNGAAGGLKSRRDPRRRSDGDMRLEREISGLRHSLTRAEILVRNAERERDLLLLENAELRSSLERRSSFKRRRVALAVAAIGALATAGVVVAELRWRETSETPGSLENEAAASVAVPRPAKVRSTGAPLFPEPDKNGTAITTLPSGTKVVVKRLFWRSLMQWAEVDALGQHGYVVTTGIDIS